MYNFATPYAWLLFTCAVISLVVGWATWRQRASRSAKILFALSVCVAIWVIGNALELSAIQLSLKTFWARMEYFGIVLIPVFWFLFALNHSQNDRKLSYYQIILLLVIPATTVIMAFTNDVHHLLWDSVSLGRDGNFTFLVIRYGIWFWVHWMWSYVLITAGTVLILQTIGRRKGIYRQQTIALLIAVIAPWTGNILYVLGVSPLKNLDATPFVFLISLVALSWGILGKQLVNLVPFAHEFVFDTFAEGILVFDNVDLLTDINPRGAALLGVESNWAIGKSVAEILHFNPVLVERFLAGETSLGEMEMDRLPIQWLDFQAARMDAKGQNRVGTLVTIQDITRRKRMEAQLVQMSRAVETSPFSIMIADPEGRVGYVNPAYEQKTGLHLQDLQGISPPTMRFGFSPPEEAADMWRTVRNGAIWTRTLKNKDGAGNPLWEQVIYSPVLDSEGQVTHVVAVRVDITRTQKLQENLASRTQALSTLHDITLNLLNHHDVQSLHEAIVQQAAHLMNSTFVELVVAQDGHYVIGASTHPDQSPRGSELPPEHASLSHQVFGGGQAVQILDFQNTVFAATCSHYIGLERVTVHPVKIGGQTVAALAVGWDKHAPQPTREDDQIADLFIHLTGLVLENTRLYRSALEEIAERRHSQEMLEASERRYRQMVENASDYIYRLNTEARFVYVNPPMIHLLGYPTEEELLQTYALDLVDETERDWVDSQISRQVLERIPSMYLQFQAVTKSGLRIWVGQNSELIVENGEVVGLQAVARDIGPVKQAEESLRLARDQAEQVSRLKSQLLANVTHELRTPLGVILGFADLLDSQALGPLTPDQHNAVSKIVESVNYQTNLVNNLLDEAQLSARKMTLRLTSTDLRPLFQSVRDSLAPLAAKKNVQILLDMEETLPAAALVDPARLQQVLVNLMSNAIKFSNGGTVRTYVAPLQNNRWMVEVSDNGIGIPEEMLDRIFEPFEQGEVLMEHHERGTGLGLTITRQLVELMGGSIMVESIEGEGSTFRLVLPLAPVREPTLA